MPVPVITIAQMREWEGATWAADITESSVIERVGKAVADHIRKMTRRGDKILLLAGKGHNGDDVRAAQPHLTDRDVSLLEVTAPAETLSDLSIAISNCTLIVDGLFGIGINRPLKEEWQSLIQAINQTGIPILAVDVPSGLNGDSGQVEGAAIRANTTVTVGAPKTGLVATRADEFVGQLHVIEDTGLLPCPCTSDIQWILPSDFKKFPPHRSVASHKGSFGHVAIFAGSLGYHGAGVLAARGSIQARPGLVTLFTHELVYGPVAAQLQAAMVHPWRGGQKLPQTCNAIVFGPGLASETFPPALKNELRGFWNESPLPVVADASSLDWLPTGPGAKSVPRVMTPHPGEAARLLKTTTAEVQANRPAAVRELSKRYAGCWVVLKGHQTVIGRNTGPIYINSSGNPFLAQGGSGDVLAGFLGGLLAQPALVANVEKTITYAVWQHGASADLLTEIKPNWTVEDLIQYLGSVDA